MTLLGAYVSGNAPAATDIPGGGSERPVASWLAPDVGALDLPQELLVGLGGAHLVDHQLQRLRGLQRTEDPAQLPGHDQLLVSEPPSSMLRAAPRKRLGGYRAEESTPPDRILPLAGVARL